MTFDVPPLDDRLAETLVTPCLLVWPARVEANIARMVEIARSAVTARLRSAELD